MPSMLELGAIALTPAARRRKIYDLALQLGSPPEEAESLSTNPDAMQFLDAKLTRMRAEKKFPEGQGLPPSRIPPFTTKDILPESVQYSLGLSDMEPKFGDPGFMEPAQAPSAPAPTPAPADMFVGPQLPPLRTSGLTSGLSNLPPGGFMPPGQDRFDRTARAATDKEAGDKRRMLLALAEGLTRAGATASNVRGLSDILAGQARQPADQSTADMLAKVRELSEERDVKKLEDAKNPIVDTINKEYGTSFTTPDQAREFMSLKKAKADIFETEESAKLSAAKRGAAISEQEANQRYLRGSIEAAPEEIKKMIFDQRKAWRSETLTVDMRKALDAANKIDSLLDAENSTASRTAIVHMVKVAGDTGRLSDQDISRFEHRMGIKGFGDWIHKMVFSDLSDEQKEEFKEIAREVRQKAIEGIMESARDYTSGIAEVYPALKEDQLMSIFLGKEFGKGKENRVEMFSPDGTQKLPVKPEHVERFKAMGWTE